MVVRRQIEYIKNDLRCLAKLLGKGRAPTPICDSITGMLLTSDWPSLEAHRKKSCYGLSFRTS